MFMDITQRKKAEDELRESEEKFRTLFNEAMDAIFVADAETGVLVDCNQAAMELVGRTKPELIGKHQRILHPGTETKNEGFTNTFQQHIGESQGQILETQVITKTGEIKEVAIKGSIVELRGRKVLQGIFRDISEQKKAERTTLEIQQDFKALFAGNPEAAAHVGPNFCILDINPRFEMLFGYKLDEVKGRNINDVVVPKDKIDEAQKLDRKAEEDKHVSQDTVRRKKDGSLVPVFVSAAPIAVEGRFLGYVATYKDISDLKKAQEESEESRRHFQSLFNMMADPVAIVDGKGKVLDTTSRVQEITGFKKEEIVGKNFLKLKMFSAGTKAVMIKNLARRMMGIRLSPYEVEIITKDGRKLPFEINAAKIEYKGKPADLVVFHDISERKKLEEKLRVVGGLTRHDVRNKLAAITVNAYLLKKQLAGNSEVLGKLKNMEIAVQQVTEIFDFAKTYEMLGAEKLVYVDVEKSVEEAISLFSGLKDVEVVDDCQGLEVLADSLLRQLFYNLIDNSLKHGQKTTRIRTHYEQMSREELKLVYEDDGVGIPAAEKPKLFNEGYSTGGSTGYGLYLIHKIVEVYGWTIQEIGEPSRGVRFVLTIPMTNSNGKENYRIA
jgi:PAS domain S-box-containing protein